MSAAPVVLPRGTPADQVVGGQAETSRRRASRASGAYGATMASNYNSRPRAPEVIVKGKRFFIAKRGETYEDLIRGEKILFL